MLAELTIKDFLARTAGNDPVPGGGSISALNGALAVALAQMVAGLTIGRKKYADCEEEMKALAAHFEQVRGELVSDIDNDAEAYNRVFAAFKMPKESDEEKALRTATIQQETKHAAEVPMGVARKVCESLGKLEIVAQKGNQNAVTDACVAAMCARTAVLGALMNVRINLTSITDETYVARMESEAKELERKALETEQTVMNHLKNVLNS